MKTLKILFTILSAAIFTVSCSSDDDKDNTPKFETENPLAVYYTQTEFTTVTNFVNSGDYEFGLVFTPTVKGNIKAVTLKLPAVNSAVRVTIWDYTTKAVLRSETINAASADVEVKKEISVLALEKDKKYLISMNSNDWYKKNKADLSNVTYPIVAGHITFNEYRWISGTSQTFPTNVSANYNAGDLSFDFQQTE
jgi:PBP1b-binding outer membrane lipoprotein LpoB